MDSSGCTAEFLLKEKVESLGKSSTSTSTINKILRNIVGAGAQPGGGVSRGKSSDAEKDLAADKTQNPQMSEESVRKLNAKRKKIARRLLKKVRAKVKKDGHPSASTSLVTTPIASPPKPIATFVEGTKLPTEASVSQQQSATEPKSPDSSTLYRFDSLRQTDSTSAETRKPGGERQRVGGGDSPLGSSPSGDGPVMPNVSEPSLDCCWNVSEQEDEFSSLSSVASESSSDSEKGESEAKK